MTEVGFSLGLAVLTGGLSMRKVCFWLHPSSLKVHLNFNSLLRRSPSHTALAPLTSLFAGRMVMWSGVQGEVVVNGYSVDIS